VTVPPEFQPFLDAPARAAVLTDFDGTLSPIVDDPASAQPLPGVVDVLDRLHARFGLVGVVSGRPVSYLLDRLGDRLWLSGLYGLEQVVDGERLPTEGAAEWRPVVDEVAALGVDELGPLVEHKGLSLTLHFRTAPERELAVRSWADRQADRTGLVVRSAKASVELHPPVAADKGTVVEAVADRFGAVCFLGDDLGDLPAFDALDRLAVAGTHVVRVGVRTPEAPAAVLDRADVVVDGPEGSLALLEALAR
jgi:trehalose 6-phosphate phosphatase